MSQPKPTEHKPHPVQPETQNRLLHITAVVGAAAMLSRILGFVRDMSMAWLLGSSLAADALVLALRLPTVLRRLLGEGTLSMSLTADLVRATPSGTTPALHHIGPLSRAVGKELALILGLAVLAGLIFTRPLAAALAPGQWQHAALMDSALPLLRLTLPYAFFAGLAALGMATLNALGYFLLPALLPAFFNITVLLFALLAAMGLAPAAWLLALGVLMGGLVQWLVQVLALRRLARLSALAQATQHKNSTVSQDIKPKSIALHNIALRLAAWRCLRRLPLGVLGASAPQLAMLGAMMAASWLPGGSIAALYYAERLMELPLGVAGAALSVAALPTLTALTAQQRHAEFAATAHRALCLSLCITLPACAGLLAVALPLVQTLLAHGAFDQKAVAATVLALCGYAPGLPAYGLTRPLLATCHALEQTRLAACSGLACVLLACIAALLLPPMLPPHLALLGPPLGVSLGLWGQAALLLLALRGRHPALRLPLPGKSLAQHITAACATGLVANLLCLAPLRPLFCLVLAVTGGILSCAATLALLGNAEFSTLRHYFCHRARQGERI